MRWFFAALTLAGAPFAVSCAVVDSVHKGVVENFCAADRDGFGRAPRGARPPSRQHWSPIAPPADAQPFRNALAHDPDYAEASREPAYWFTPPSGEVRLCHTALRRGEYNHPRIHNCDSKIATWWDFTRTENVPHSNGAEFRVRLTLSGIAAATLQLLRAVLVSAPKEREAMVGRILGAVFAAFAAAFLIAGPAHAQAIDTELFARDAAIKDVSLSPDGRFIAVIQRVDEGEALTIIDWRTRQSRVITLARADRFIVLEWVAWKTDNRLLFAVRQRAFWNGTQNDNTWQDIRRVFAVDRDGQHMTTMFEGQMRRLAADYAPISLIDIQHRDPENVLIGTYGQSGYTIYRANVNTGRVTQVDAFGWDVYDMLVDGAGTPVMRLEALPYNSGLRVYRRAPTGGRWILAHEETRASVAENHDFYPIGSGPGVGQIYVAARPEGQEFQSVYLYNTATGELGEPVYAHPNADAGVIGRDPNDDSLLFGCGQTERLECRASDPRVQRHFDAIKSFFEGLADFSLLDVSTDKNTWLIAVQGPTLPLAFYIYDLNATHLSLIASTRPFMPRARLAPMEIVRYTASDGAQLWGYLTTPAGPSGPRPLIVLPHGGPEARDSYSYSFMVQFLASRGYSVFQPNFRGSEGSGRSFVAAGHLQWGRRMQADISDGVHHLIDTGAADPQRICIVGGSYGGYAALAGATLTPELYRCAISIAGVSDLLQMLASERAQEGRRSATYAYWQRLIGNPSDDREALIAVSPARQVSAIRAPILLIHGSTDWTVPIEQSEIMRDAMQRAGKPVEFLRIEDESHFWSAWDPENRQRMLTAMERFLNTNLGPGVTPAAPAQ